ncbi:MFS transporter [Cognatiyoonia sp. IB215182]|uniref:MFS transporter n=1 Tax=Cognatiyoonia sp. IB215182 TaxID=3097353 RepID=UPI002A0EC66F|nr:MFS transporter [Cognatiyoonia sp. IB215182]MDX8354372.1 MFS transporter [Cognatiyoonia sp. IB215182]
MAQSRWHGAGVALICGSLILLISLGVRHGFGLFLQPVSMAQGWGRESFAFAMALQNLVWGASQPITGMIADRYGAKPVIAIGALLYAAGLWMMSQVGGETLFILGAGVLIGLGLSGTTFPVIFAAISRLVAPEQRSLAMGITMAVGSFGQFAMLPISLGLIVGFDWQGALVALSILALLMLPLGFGIRTAPAPVTSAVEDVSFVQALRDAAGERDFWLLSLGFFACGFQVVFIAIHLPAYLADEGIGGGVATTVLALIGLVNIAGAYFAGFWGGRYRKPMLLSWIYLARGVVIAAFLFLPLSAWSAYLFGAVMGLFWLSTVPLTNGTVASVFGVKHMSMLGGIVFFAHQLGSFAGGWMGGWLYDRTGNYDAAWGIAIGLSLIAALLNWPITERTLAERRATA